MKEYNKPMIIEEEFEIVDVIAESFGKNQAGDDLTDFLSD